MPSWVKIILGSTMLACALGVCMDLVTANVAVEYFTVHHPKVVQSESPWVMALVWGVGASWWFGAIAGGVLGWVNSRRAVPLPPRLVLRWVSRACIWLWAIMMSILVAVYCVGGLVPMAQRRPSFEHDRRLISVAMAHLSEYVLGGIAVLIVGLRVGRHRLSEE